MKRHKSLLSGKKELQLEGEQSPPETEPSAADPLDPH